MRVRSRVALRVVSLVAVAGALVADAESLEVRQIDPYPIDDAAGARCMPAVGTGTYHALNDSRVIDVIVLGDGYLAGESAGFFSRVQEIYDGIFGSCVAPCDGPCGGGIEPFNYFPQAFRVRAVFTASAERASPARNSYYRVKIEDGSCGIANGGWWGESGTDNEVFRQNLFGALESVDVLGPPINTRRYPSDLIVRVPGDDIPFLHNSLGNLYRNAVVMMLVRAENGTTDGCAPSGRTRRVYSNGVTVNVGMGSQEEHEFGHAFAYLEDEYIRYLDEAERHDPEIADRSIFLLSNLTYGNARCDVPWTHLGPGTSLNPDPFSLVGNLYRGGEKSIGVWHSEYKCLMNGGHLNYTCNVDNGELGAYLRDDDQLCLWCEELVVLRILEKTDYLACPSGDLGQCGRDWYWEWANGMRDDYYADPRFGLFARIANRTACYAGGLSHGGACDSSDQPACLRGCGIRDNMNAVYVAPGEGHPAPDGSPERPYDDIDAGAVAACGGRRIVLVRSGSHTGVTGVGAPALVAPEDCGSVVLQP